jgi:hypothetical protein
MAMPVLRVVEDLVDRQRPVLHQSKHCYPSSLHLLFEALGDHGIGEMDDKQRDVRSPPDPGGLAKPGPQP